MKEIVPTPSCLYVIPGTFSQIIQTSTFSTYGGYAAGTILKFQCLHRIEITTGTNSVPVLSIACDMLTMLHVLTQNKLHYAIVEDSNMVNELSWLEWSYCDYTM